jgi:hypothetical protein
MSASTMPQVGPITMWVNSTTRKPCKGKDGVGDGLERELWVMVHPANLRQRATPAIISQAVSLMVDYAYFCHNCAPTSRLNAGTVQP